MEVYWAYGSYEDMMDITEKILVECADVLGSRVIDYQGTRIDLNPPFRRATMADLVFEETGIDFIGISDEEARACARQRGVEISKNDGRYDILPLFFEQFVKEKLIQPTFVISIELLFVVGERGKTDHRVERTKKIRGKPAHTVADRKSVV